ncbi:hypothetical protein DFJ73DRAFT_896693 [Zopfochytrium polystomum]|nr:hypothetical protein DFJ73DRAFT_896693 [Zopfochytrium polystomum]
MPESACNRVVDEIAPSSPLLVVSRTSFSAPRAGPDAQRRQYLRQARFTWRRFRLPTATAAIVAGAVVLASPGGDDKDAIRGQATLNVADPGSMEDRNRSGLDVRHHHDHYHLDDRNSKKLRLSLPVFLGVVVAAAVILLLLIFVLVICLRRRSSAAAAARRQQQEQKAFNAAAAGYLKQTQLQQMLMQSMQQQQQQGFRVAGSASADLAGPVLRNPFPSAASAQQQQQMASAAAAGVFAGRGATDAKSGLVHDIPTMSDEVHLYPGDVVQVRAQFDDNTTTRGERVPNVVFGAAGAFLGSAPPRLRMDPSSILSILSDVATAGGVRQSMRRTGFQSRCQRAGQDMDCRLQTPSPRGGWPASFINDIHDVDVVGQAPM